MIIVVTGSKGGAGATTIAAAIGLAAPGHPTLVDLTGDLTAALGPAAHPSVGLAAWLASDAPAARLDELTIPLAPTRATLLPWHETFGVRAETLQLAPERLDDRTDRRRRDELLAWCSRRAERAPVVIDAGSHAIDADHVGAVPVRTVIVTRPCYLALRRSAPRADVSVLVTEPGRGLGRRDVERAVGAPVVATVPTEPGIARAVDAGLTTTALPPALRRCGSAVLRALLRDTAVNERPLA